MHIYLARKTSDLVYYYFPLVCFLLQEFCPGPRFLSFCENLSCKDNFLLLQELSPVLRNFSCCHNFLKFRESCPVLTTFYRCKNFPVVRICSCSKNLFPRCENISLVDYSNPLLVNHAKDAVEGDIDYA